MSTDQLVADYLERVRRAGAGLPPERREELLADLSEHIAAGRAELAPETEAGVRTLLDRLGDPAAIVAEATVGSPVPPPMPPAMPPPMPPARTNRTLVIVLSVLAALLVLPVLICLAGAAFFVPTRTEIHQGPIVEVSAQPVVKSGE